ncbi:MAG TPA: hypothetical protein VM097_13100 [Mycobacteriales bacterium]|nr:hypothetical protein [Mycobacteriales bacterium]
MSFDAMPAVPRWPHHDYERFVVDHLNSCEDRSGCPCWLPDLLALNDPLLPGEATDTSR